MPSSHKAHPLITGTLLLTTAGLLARILGFFYRIFLSRTIGAEGLGIYQMIFPVYGIFFSLCAGSIQTAISRFIAADPDHAKRTLLSGFSISFTLSLAAALMIRHFSEPLAEHILLEPRCAPLLSVMAFAIPCTSIHACICGYYYGKEKVSVPAASQLLEQMIRIFTVFLLVSVCIEKQIPVTVSLAVFGLVAGEAGSALFVLIFFLLFHEFHENTGRSYSVGPALLALAAPLMANRLVLNLLQSTETIMIPERLTVYGLTRSQAVRTYGTLTGMAMPFVLFPSALVNSLAVVLLPVTARHQSAGNDSGIADGISMSFRYSLYLGIFCIGIFTVFGEALGLQIFKSQDAGSFIQILAWLCPFLYLATSSGSILNGLGKTKLTFFHHLISLLVRIAFVWFGIPEFGIRACLWGMLASEIFLALLHVLALRRIVPCDWNAWILIGKPVFCLLCALWIFRLFPEDLPIPAGLPDFFRTAAQILLLSTMYLLFLLLFHRKQSPTAT
ncbi:polysaccharide biosynthesis protein [Clostridium sp. AM30-24]|nr:MULTISPECIES: polysaccharide biosynthesis protein [unclassified Clostridium]RHS24992.1 polysaccharide biosynthesis protein [Clostridium sp. AF12-28]RHS28877.1 polysaccharide biosynthesis protein [Clostridium sp. AF12-19]RHT42785.1 polysaccharide biosynthesis protein [Clostridium sp. AM30-24]